MHTHDHGTGTEEQQRLEEGMGHQVEYRHRIGRGAQRNRHVAELRQRRVRHHPLDVVLNQAEETHEQRCDRPDHHHERQRRVRQLEQRRHPRHHEDARSHHGRRVNQRRNRRWAFHRIRQPDVQRELGALAHRADEQANAGDGQQRPFNAWEQSDGLLREPASGSEHGGVVQRAEITGHKPDAKRETEVTDTVHQKRFEVGVDRRRTRVPEPD